MIGNIKRVEVYKSYALSTLIRKTPPFNGENTFITFKR
jgi:hypothetical protein